MSRLWTIIEVATGMTKLAKKLAHFPLRNPGRGVHGAAWVEPEPAARDIDVNPARVNDVVHGRSAITAAIALRLAKYFGTTPELWLNLQSDYDLRRARWRLAEN
jgi:addiction module HigA family antidote